MDIEAYIKEQNVLISMIAFYMLCTLLQEASFAAMLKCSPGLLKRSTELITPFATIMGKFVFIADGLIKKNIYQIKAYSFLIIYTLTMACFGFIKTKGTSLIFNYIAVILICLDGIYTFYQVRRLSHKYAWHFYKKLGLSEELQSVNKLKQRLNVFYTLNVFLSITNFSYPVNSSTIVTVSNYTCLVLTLATSFFFTQWIDEENRIVRKITIGITATELILEFIEFLTLFNHIVFYNIFVLVSLFFSTINSILLICYLYFDMQTFGNGYTYALKQNVRRIRDKIENEK